MIRKVSLLVGLWALVGLTACAHAQGQPVQWRYDFQSGVAVATYPSDIIVQGTTTFNGPRNESGPGGFWTNTNPFANTTLLPGIVDRINRRVQIGAATAESGDFCYPARAGCTSTGATTKSWYETLETATSPYGFRDSWAQLSVGAINGGIGVLGYARSSDVTDSSLAGLQLGVGGWFAGYNDNTTIQQHTAGFYAVGIRAAGAGMTTTGTGTIGGEIDIANRGNVVQIVPGNLYPTTGFTTALQLNSGASYTGVNTASAALSIGNNLANFNAGIVIAQNAINGLTYDGGGNATGGAGSAVRAGVFQAIEWWNNAGSAPTSQITSEQLTPANAQAIRFQDTGIVFGGPVGASRSFETVYPGGATGAWIRTTPAFGTTPATLDTSGANNDLRIMPAGAGALRLTSSAGMVIPEITAASAVLPPAGSQTLFIDSADHKLKRKDSAGTVVIGF